MAGWGGIDQILEEAKQRKLAEVRDHARLTGPRQQPQQQQQQTPPVVEIAIQQQRPTQRQPSSDPRPPLPTRMPAITPVADLKNRTAMHQQYSPETAKQLYETPTRVRYGLVSQQQPDERWPGLSGSEGVAGWYQGPFEDGSGEKIHLNGQMNQTKLQQFLPANMPSPDNTYAHEFAHKRYGQMDPELRSSWDNTALDIASDYALARLGQRSQPQQNMNELFAHNAEQGPFAMLPAVRDHYYAGMYRDDLQQPPPDEPLSGAWQAPKVGFDPQNWVKERNAPKGYYEDGGAVTTARPYPSQWEQPRFPSVKMYNETVPEWYGSRG